MDKRLPIGLWLVALLQWMAPMIGPPALLVDVPLALWIAIAVIFGLVAINLLRRRFWSHTAHRGALAGSHLAGRHHERGGARS